MKRALFFIYGLICYGATVATLLYMAGFLANIGVPKSIDSPPTAPLMTAIFINVGLLAVFGVQHSVMARKGFKRVWTKVVPQEIERSTYCLFAAAALALLMWKWSPLGGMIWDLDHPVLRYGLMGVSLVGWVIIYYSSFLINHFDLFGMRQVWLQMRGKPYTPLKFNEPTLYKYTRHPIYLGMLLAVWATPTMTVTHLFFGIGVLGYILVGIQLEERDMISEHGKSYAEYRRRVPMLVPKVKADDNTPAGAEHQGVA